MNAAVSRVIRARWWTSARNLGDSWTLLLLCFFFVSLLLCSPSPWLCRLFLALNVGMMCVCVCGFSISVQSHRWLTNKLYSIYLIRLPFCTRTRPLHLRMNEWTPTIPHKFKLRKLRCGNEHTTRDIQNVNVNNAQKLMYTFYFVCLSIF